MPVLIISPSGAITQKATLVAAFAAANIGDKTIMVTTDQTVNSLTAPAGVKIEITNMAVISVNLGQTLDLTASEFFRPHYNCFGGAGTVTLPQAGPGATQDFTAGAITGVSAVLSSFLNEAKGGDIASATTTSIGSATGNYINVTGTTTITSLGAAQAGTRRIVNFSDALTLTHNPTSLILPTAANIATAAGDTAVFVSLGGGNWKCVGYTRADGSNDMSVLKTTYAADFAATVAAEGTQKFKNGLVVKWGVTAVIGAGSSTHTFASAFPTGCLQVILSPATGSATVIPGTTDMIAASFTLNNSGALESRAFRFIAIGY